MARERAKRPGRSADPDRPLRATFDRIARESLHILKADRSVLFLHRPSTDSFQVEASFGLSKTYLEAVSSLWRDLPLGHLLREPGFLYSRDARSDPQFDTIKGNIETEGFRSIAGVPLVSEGVVLGSLGIYFDEIRELSPGERSTIQTFADLAAIAIENASALEEIRLRSERQEALRRVNQHLTENLDLTEVFTRICESVYELLKTDFIHLLILDESSGAFKHGAAFDDSDPENIGSPHIPKGKSLSHRVAAKRKPITVRNILNDPDLFNPDWAVKKEIKSYLGLPLILEDSVAGVLNCFTREDREFSADEIDLAGVFATQAAVALRNAQAFDELNRKSAQISKLNEINRKLTSAFELDEILDSILEGSKELVGGRYAICYLYDEAEKNLVPYRKALSRFARGVDFPNLAMGQGLVGSAAETREPLVAPEAQKDPRWMAAPWNEELTLGSFAGIPLISRGVLLGVLGFFAESEDRLREGGLELLKVFADQAAIAIEKARQVESLKNRIAEQEGLAGALHHIPSGLRVEKLIEAVLAESERVMGTDRCSVMLPDARSGRPRHFVSRGISAEFVDRLLALPDPFPVGRNYLDNPNHESPTVIHDVDAHSEFGAIQGREGHRVLAAFPIRVGGRNIGALFFFWTTPQQIGPQKLNLGQAIADQVAVAFENARLYSEAQRRTTTLEVLDELSRAINSTLDLEDLFRIAVEQVRRLVPCERCSIYKLESDKRDISRIYAVDEVEDRKDRLVPISMSGSGFEEILDAKKALYMPDSQKDPHPKRQLLATEGLRSVIISPILIEGDCIGFLNALSSEVDAYTEAHIELLVSVADRLALAMKNAELYAQVRETGERLDNFVRGASDAIITVDLEGRITSWNPGAEAIYGYSEAELLGQSILRIYLEETEEYKEFWDQLSAGKTVSPVETNRRRKDGSAVEVSVTVSPLRNNQGDIVGYSGIHRDIGARKRAEETLRKSERNYRTLFEQASDAIEIIDEKGRIIDCNQKACSMLGYEREELLGRQLSVFVSPEHRDTLSQRIARIVDHGLDAYESVNIRKDGTLVPLEVSPGFIEVEGKNHIIFFLRDISERKQAQEMLMRHQKLAALGRLSAGMAHEILNPTNIIGLFAQLLSKDARNPDSVREAADSIRLNVGRIAKICDSLRRFSRGGESSISRFDLGALIQETVSMMEMQIKIEDSSISLELPEGSVSIEADRDQIAQILLNLLSNARDAMPEGGRITLRLEEFQKEGAPWVGLSVQDEEEGIPEDKLTQIFDPFFTTKDEEKGTGLGLSIVHGIADGHGGTIDVRSRVGEGSTFHIALPCNHPELLMRKEEGEPGRSRKVVGRA